MTTDQILTELELKRREQVGIRDSAIGEIARLEAGIAALNGGTAAPAGPSVVEMVLESCKAFHAQHGAGDKPLVISFDNIKQTAKDLFPTSYSRIKTGMYAACAKLVNKQKLKAVVGGFEVTG